MLTHVARAPAELWTDQLQECDSDDDAESIEVAEQKCVLLICAAISLYMATWRLRQPLLRCVAPCLSLRACGHGFTLAEW